MQEYISKEHQAAITKLEPVIKHMKPERAKEFADLLADMQGISEAWKKLTRAIDSTKILQDKDLARYAEGLDAAEAETLKVWLKQQHDEIDIAYYGFPPDNETLYGKLSTTAIDVYYDAQNAEEEIAAKE